MADDSSGTGAQRIARKVDRSHRAWRRAYATGTIGQREQATVKFQLPKAHTNNTR